MHFSLQLKLEAFTQAQAVLVIFRTSNDLKGHKLDHDHSSKVLFQQKNESL
jgi:hypothetical protein